jgi:protein gp37
MARASNISWTDATWSPWWGCTEVSPACDNCYARTLAKRAGLDVWGKDKPRKEMSEAYWKEPLKWDQEAARTGKRIRVFPSLCDPFEEREDLEYTRDVFYDLIETTLALDWLLLTKRPQAIHRLWPASWWAKPKPNVMMMATVETADYLWRIAELCQVPAASRGLSVGPLLGPLSLKSHLRGIDVVIVEGESSKAARPMHPDWVRRIRDECLDAGVVFHFKQWGEWEPFSTITGEQILPLPTMRYDVATRDGFLRAKSTSLPLLDGQTYLDFPPVSGRINASR